jgi:hypothetical protein
MMVGLNCGRVSAMWARDEFGVPARRCGGAALASDGSCGQRPALLKVPHTTKLAIWTEPGPPRLSRLIG